MAAEARATEAQLRLLQGQIEPHFLFNTLAGVISLIDHDTARAKHTLQTFTEYLRSSLGTLRRDEGPLAQDLELAQNYLLLMQARMEDRLRFRIDADDAARRALLPPLLLQPLVENAVQHGLEPSIAGGEVVIRAHAQGGKLVLEVCDDGQGLDAPRRRARGPGGQNNGVALDNLRSRLRTRWGDAARLEFPPAQRGTRAVITMPLEAAATGAAP
jgi:sensor histidine kinase YesM